MSQIGTVEQQCFCTECGRGIECCWYCEEDDCGVPICYRCLAEALGTYLVGPHEHGG
jgi:hypothetical protein